MSLWDTGVLWYDTRIVEPLEEPLDVAYVRDKVLRVTNGSVEDSFIAEAIRTAREQCEAFTGRAVMPQTRALVGDRFPTGHVELPYPPLIEVVSIVYINGADTPVTLDASAYAMGRHGAFGTIRTLSSWPSTATRADAVTITYRAGYEDDSVSPAEPNVPASLKAGMGLIAGELYKQRSLSVHGFGVGQSPALLSAEALWGRFKVQAVLA